jgi:hypothetical protein
MRQFGVWAKICVRKKENRYSSHAQLYGGFMRQKWRIYGISNRLSNDEDRTIPKNCIECNAKKWTSRIHIVASHEPAIRRMK